jgi:hypothetical protein
MENPNYAVTIETLGKENAIGIRKIGKGKPINDIPTKLPTNIAGNFECPCCLRIIGTPTIRGKFTKSGSDEKSNVDHTNPIGYAYVNYNDDALCAQLVYICFDCNMLKSQTSLTDFFYTLCYNHKRYFEHSTDTKEDLPVPEFNKRKEFYIKNIHYTLECGVNSLETMITKAKHLKEMYIAIDTLKDKAIIQSKEIREIVETFSGLSGMYRGIGDPDEQTQIDISIQDIKTLFGTQLKAYKLMGFNDETAIHNLIGTIQLQGEESDKSSTNISVKVLAQFIRVALANGVTASFKRDPIYAYADTMAIHLAKNLNEIALQEITPETIIAEQKFINFCQPIIDSKQDARFQPVKITVPGIPGTSTQHMNTARPSDIDATNAANALIVLTAPQMDIAGNKAKKKYKKNKTYKNIKRR